MTTLSTMKRIAEETNLSIGTVSLVLNGRGDELRISKKTQQLVLETARRLGYLPNVSARRLRQASGAAVPVIAAFWPTDLSPEIIGRFFTGAQSSLLQQEKQFEMMIQPYRRSQIHKLRNICDSGIYNGVIITGLSEEDQRYLEENQLDIPTVLFNRESRIYSNVHVDNYEIGRKTAELFASRGHRRVGIIMPVYGEKTRTSLRNKGFIESCGKKGLSLDPHHIQNAPMTMEGGNIAARRMLEADGDPPTAVFFSISIMAVAALPVFHQAGIKIPDDMEIMTYGDHEIERYTFPSLSTVKLPVEEMAQACIRLVIERIRGMRDEPASLVFDTPFVFRESCGGFVKQP